MNILIKSSSIQFKNPNIGQPTRAVEDHYNGRRVTALVGGKEEMIRFNKDELSFDADEDETITAISNKLKEEEN